MVRAKKICYIEDIYTLLSDSNELNRVKKGILDGDLFIIKSVYPRDFISKIKYYLTDIGRGSLPNYHPIKLGAPNFHRINIWDERAYVKCCFHQFTFFPWNQDVFRLFERAKSVYQLKNLISGLTKDKFLEAEPSDGFVARLSFQFYPSGTGGMNKHSDPVDKHQLVVPTLVMSEKGKDFQTGGVFAEADNGELIFLDDITNVGDVILFNAQIPHGVKIIDEEKQEDWLSFQGRWMMIFATNKVANSDEISDAIDLEEAEKL